MRTGEREGGEADFGPLGTQGRIRRKREGERCEGETNELGERNEREKGERRDET